MSILSAQPAKSLLGRPRHDVAFGPATIDIELDPERLLVAPFKPIQQNADQAAFDMVRSGYGGRSIEAQPFRDRTGAARARCACGLSAALQFHRESRGLSAHGRQRNVQQAPISRVL
jgi:hypothetical protein